MFNQADLNQDYMSVFPWVFVLRTNTLWEAMEIFIAFMIIYQWGALQNLFQRKVIM